MQKLGLKIKFVGSRQIDTLLKDYKILLDDCLGEVKRRFELYDELKEKKEGKCGICKEEKKLYWKNEEQCICGLCFSKQWSEYTIWNQYHKELEEKYPVFEGNKGYYNGAIPNAVQIFKSYLEKKKKRDYEIQKKKDDILIMEGEINSLEYNLKILKNKVKKTSDLSITAEISKTEKELNQEQFRFRRLSKRKLSQISFPRFSGKTAYMGNQNMFKFIPNLNETYKLLKNEMIKEDFINLKREISVQTKEGYLHNKWQLSLTNPYKKNDKLIFDMQLGKKNYYQKKFILDCIEKEQWKLIRAKISKQDNSYYLVFPARVIEEACVNLEKEMKKNKAKNVTFCCLSFGIEKPISLVAIKNRKPIAFRTFGNAYPLWRAERETLLKAKISRNIHLHHGIMDYFFNIKHEEADRFFSGQKTPNECPICGEYNCQREYCKNQYTRLMNEFYPLQDKIKSKKIKKKLKRERDKFRKRHEKGKKRNAMIKIFQEKMRNKLANFKNTYDHQISFEVVDYCKKFDNPVILMRDTKGIKNISYQSFYRRLMKDWSINQQKLFIRYKGLLNGQVHYSVPYKQLSDIPCPKCNEKIGKTTTMKLKRVKLLECPGCKFVDSFSMQDCFFIYKKFMEGVKK